MSITDLAKPEFWQQLLSSDFNRGYIAGLGLVIALLVFWSSCSSSKSSLKSYFALTGAVRFRFPARTGT